MSIVLACAVLFSSHAFANNWACDYLLPQCPEKEQKFRRGIDEIGALKDANKITSLEMSKKYLELTLSMYPKDKTLIDMFTQSVLIKKFLASKGISEDEILDIRKISVELYEEIIADRFQMANAFMEADKEYQKQQQSRSNYGNVAATATMLNGIGRAFNNSFGQSITPPLQICTYYGGTRYCQ